MEQNSQYTIGLERRLIRTLLSKKPSSSSFVVSLAVFLICVFVSLTYWNNWQGANLLAASGERVFVHHEYWRLVTSLFVHGDLGHLLANSYMLVILGFLAHAYFGGAVYPLMSLLLGAVINLLALATYAPHMRLVGASGLVYFLGGFWLMMFLFIERRYSIASRIVRALGFGLMIFFPSVYQPTVSYRTHAIGMGVGILFAMIYFFYNRHEIRGFERFQVIEEPPFEIDDTETKDVETNF